MPERKRFFPIDIFPNLGSSFRCNFLPLLFIYLAGVQSSLNRIYLRSGVKWIGFLKSPAQVEVLSLGFWSSPPLLLLLLLIQTYQARWVSMKEQFWAQKKESRSTSLITS